MAGTVNPMDIGRKRKKSVMGTYFPTRQQLDAWTWCVKNNIRISFKPGTIRKGLHIKSFALKSHFNRSQYILIIINKRY